jgi:hypothetical protein
MAEESECAGLFENYYITKENPGAGFRKLDIVTAAGQCPGENEQGGNL